MQKNTSVSLSNHFALFINEQVKSGRYGSASDVVRAGLRLLEDQEARMKQLREALEAGERSGLAAKTSKEEFLKRMHEKYLS